MKYLPWIVCSIIALAYPFAGYLPALVPGTDWGLVGVLAAPLRHATLLHLAVNLLPLAYLLSLMRNDPPARVIMGLLTIVVVGGMWVWFWGRLGIHEGASGLTLGVLAMLAMRTDYRSVLSVAALVGTGIALEYVNIPEASWETHLGGFVAGAYYGIITLNWKSKREMDHDDESSSAQATPCPAKCRSDSRPHYPGPGR